MYNFTPGKHAEQKITVASHYKAILARENKITLPLAPAVVNAALPLFYSSLFGVFSQPTGRGFRFNFVFNKRWHISNRTLLYAQY